MKKIILILFFLLCGIYSYSQTHISRMKGVEVSGGTSLNGGFNFNLAPSYFVHKNIYLKLNLGFDLGDDHKYDSITKMNTKVSYNLYSVDLIGYYKVFDIKDRNYSNIGIGLSGLYNQVNNIQYTPNQSGFNFGGLVSYENEFYFYKKWAHLFTIRQYFYLDNPEVNRDFTPTRLIFTMGIKKVF